MRYAFADPPYPGCAHYYEENSEVDYAELIAGLNAHYDGWALCLGSVNLYDVLPLCPPDVRVCAWVKTFAAFKPNVNPAYAWEPVIIRGARAKRERTEDTVRDWVSAPITLRKGLVGAKPMAFNLWIIDVLGVTDEDTLDDLFPGTEGLMAAWGASMQELLFVS
jgi:hypothetical protein